MHTYSHNRSNSPLFLSPIKFRDPLPLNVSLSSLSLSLALSHRPVPPLSHSLTLSISHESLSPGLRQIPSPSHFFPLVSHTLELDHPFTVTVFLPRSSPNPSKRGLCPSLLTIPSTRHISYDLELSGLVAFSFGLVPRELYPTLSFKSSPWPSLCLSIAYFLMC
jgi:hypothetical protein